MLRSPRSGPVPLLIFLALHLAACGGGDTLDGDVRTRVDSTGGVVRIHNAGSPPGLSLEPLFTVGSMADLQASETESVEEFGDIRTVLIGPHGSLFVGDAHSDQITVFDSTGAFQRLLGRRGAGPGEIENLQDMGWIGDTLVVMDSQNGRLTRLTRDGEYVGEWPFMRASGSGVRMQNVGTAELFSFAIRLNRDASGSGRPTPVWARFGPAGALDTVPRHNAADELPDGTYALCRGNGGLGYYENPVGEALLSRPAPGMTQALAFSSAYHIAFVNPAGDTVRTLSRDAVPVPLSDEDWAPVAESYGEWTEAWKGADCEGGVERPATRRLLLGLHYDDRGRLLVEYEDARGRALDLYDDNGRWIGRAPFVERDPAVDPAFRDGRVAVVRLDDLDVQRVEVFRLVAGENRLRP